MSVGDMLKSVAGTLLLLIVLNLALFTLGVTPWLALGLLCLAAGMFLSWRQGLNYGHQACAILQTVERARDPESPSYGQVDGRVQRRAWSVSTGIRAVLAAALGPYALGCAYIILSLLDVRPACYVMRVVTWVFAAPFWPLMLPFSQTFDRLTGWVAAILLISPFILPLCVFAGYLQGPKLWAKSEKAMAEGKRRAKAKSRVAGKKAHPRTPKPEI